MHGQLGLNKVGAVQAVETVGPHDPKLGLVYLVFADVLGVKLKVFIEGGQFPYQLVRIVETLVFACFVEVEVLVPDELHVCLLNQLLEVQSQLVLFGLVGCQQVNTDNPLIELLHLRKVSSECLLRLLLTTSTHLYF